MKRRVGAIEEFSFEPLTLIGSSLQAHRTVKQLHITIAVTGWLNDANPGNIIAIYYLNTAVQYSAMFTPVKLTIFRYKNCDYFLKFAQNIDCGYTLELMWF